MFEELIDDSEMPYEKVERLQSTVYRVQRLALASLIASAGVALIITLLADRWSTLPRFSRVGLPALLLWLVVAAAHALNWLYSNMRWMVETAERMAVVDANTHCFNYRYLMMRLSEERERCNRYEGHFSVLYVDLDDFKQVNDRFGHNIGNVVLQDLAALMQYAVRGSDILGRLGGDEFLAILPDTEPDDAAKVATRIRDAVADYVLDMGQEGKMDFVRVSVGVAGYPDNGSDVTNVITAADHAVYDAKGKGGNRASISREYISTTTVPPAAVRSAREEAGFRQW